MAPSGLVEAVKSAARPRRAPPPLKRVLLGESLVLFVRALRLLGSARTGSYFASAPLIAGVLSVVVLRESPNARLVDSFVLVGLAGVLMARESHAHEHTHGDSIHSHWHRPDGDHRHRH